MMYSTLIRYATVCTIFFTQEISAHEIGPSLDCRSSPGEFIAQLSDENDIGRKPIHVSDDSVSAYRPRPQSKLTALGFKVQAVFASSVGNKLSIQTAARGTAQPVYGAVVLADADTISKRIRDIGSPAKVKEVVPLIMTAVVCD